jgi:hypothetical protein
MESTSACSSSGSDSVNDDLACINQGTSLPSSFLWIEKSGTLTLIESTPLFILLAVITFILNWTFRLYIAEPLGYIFLQTTHKVCYCYCFIFLEAEEKPRQKFRNLLKLLGSACYILFSLELVLLSFLYVNCLILSLFLLLLSENEKNV